MKARHGGRKPNASSGLVNLTNLRVTMCCKRDDRCDEQVRALQRQRVEVSRMWPPPAGRLDPDMDVLVCDYFPQLADLIPWVAGDAKAALIVLLPQDQSYDDNVLVACAPHSVVQRPIQGTYLTTAIKLGWSQYRYEKRMQDRVSKLDEVVRTMRDVERAKLIVMAQKKVDGDTAYRQMRQAAMKSQTSISALAKNIIDSLET